MALADLARDHNGVVVGRYRLVHSGGLNDTPCLGFTFQRGVCEVDAKGREAALVRVVASFGRALTVTRLDPRPQAPPPSQPVAAVPLDRAAQARDLHGAGMSWAKIGERMGISGERARQLARRCASTSVPPEAQ